MDQKTESLESLLKLKVLCSNLIQNHKDIKTVKELNSVITSSPKTFIRVVQPTILSCFYPILKNISEDKSSFSNSDKQLLINTLKNVFNKSNIDNLGLFFNIYAFLLFEIYNHKEHKVLNIHEEYKLSIIECMTSLTNCLTFELVQILYTKENAPRLCQMLYVAIEIAKTEQLKCLRISALECIMSIARVLDDNDFQDVVIRNQVAEVFLFFLPGIASGLTRVMLIDEKEGHKIPMVALRAWGRIITLLMQDYNPSDKKFDFTQIKDCLDKSTPSTVKSKEKWKDDKEINEYLQSKRTLQWYAETDKQLQILVMEIAKLTYHSHPKVRLELANVCDLISEKCFSTMPKSLSKLIEMVIALTEDEDEEIVKKSKQTLSNLSNFLPSDTFKSSLENLEEGFYTGINSLPRKFNGIDEREQLVSLNILTGYVNLFGEHKLNHVLLSADYLKRLMLTLIHISELEKSHVSLLEEHRIRDLDVTSDLKTPWKQFRHFKEDSIKNKLEKLCSSLASYGAFRMVSDFLLDTIMYDAEHRKEAIFILNEIILGSQYSSENLQIIEIILNTYTDNTYWQVPLDVGVDDFGCQIALGEVQNNVIQVCLLVEGIGKMSLALKGQFQKFLLKTLYLVLERAGSGHPFIKSAGLLALTHIACGCGYSDVNNLINSNIDYLSFYVERNLNKIENNENVLSVLTVILKYSTMDILKYIADIIKEVLMQSCDKFKERNATAFLQVFLIFTRCLRRWLNIEVKVEPIKSKLQKLKELEDFKVTGLKNMEEERFSDDIMGKTAEDMYKEDMLKNQKELEEEIEEPQVEEYKKPDPPMHIKLTVAILGRSLHFLPSKDRMRKLLVLEILNDGLEIIRDWEDELLPIVHLIWSPLVQRFGDLDDPLIINHSFQLLVTLARLSKDFIRMRTTKDVLPNAFQIMNKLAQKSYLKDKGSAFRYSQAYKLQLTIIENLAKVLADLDVQEDILKNALDSAFTYLSDKQPLPLQSASIEFIRNLSMYDLASVRLKVDLWVKENVGNEYEKNVIYINDGLNQIK